MLSREGNSTVYNVVAEVMGRKMTSVTKITTFPKEKIEAETTDGDGKGTTLAFTFQSIPGGTQITLEGDVILPGFAKLLGSAVKGRIESAMEEELATVKDVLEKT